MALPLPGPSALVDLTRFAVGQAAGTAATVVALPTRALGLLDGVEALLKRINTVVDRAEAAVGRAELVLDEAEDAVRQVAVISTAATVAIEEATRVANSAGALVADAGRVAEAATVVIGEAERVSVAAGAVVADAEQVTGKATAAMASAELIASTADELLTAYETTLRKGAPMVSRFVEQLSAEEVDAAIRLIDELPKLTEHLTSDVLPILATLDRVGPDIHDLLDVTRDLKLAVAGIPGLKMLARRGDRRTEENGGR